ncbi:hypothetical protein BTV20_03140 [Histophilus somni]|uniref:YadA-like family protein n=6 Tax=Histophilus somni TaxID=731 RepID=A0A9Q6Z1I0_HISSO|nr:YadA-like family protein [Histophilus somni]ARU64558.1 hypothetical protein BTV18_03135 [Histophilus somni]ARU66344.1 hypothetical protein BTV19_03130 [Histophilus somni]ARU68219.1 hypothetical protein BTV16_03130 [Histophilus somni]ARU70099.1 hypothetical protein BTV20_03140 [Histophilus somni]ARU71973.1 hypothetical protein BTV17_03130 [Histophilus somni]
MNKIFKTKYDITTGQCKAVSELASNRQIASSSKSKPKCGVFLGNFLGIFKFSPLVLLMSGMLGVSSVSYAEITYIDMDGTTGAAGVQEKWGEAPHWKNGSENILIAPVQDKGTNLNKFGGKINTNVQHSVIIGPHAAGRQHKQGMTVLGHGAVGYESQATALGNNTYAGGQATAIGSDVMAGGLASIAIGNDDIYTDANYDDELPEKTILKIYGYTDKRTSKKYTNYSDVLDQNEFKKKYVRNGHINTKVYSPTYAAGVAAIAIGSRSVAYGDTSLSIGTLSFALGDRSTAVGFRAFVDFAAEGGVAIGDESRVFAANSFAVGNNAESTNKGALSFGSFSKAVGEGSIAIGQNVGSNAKLSGDADTELEKLIMTTTQTAQPSVSPGDHGSATITYNNTPSDQQLKFGDKNEVVKLGFAASNQNGNPVSMLIEKLIQNKEKQKAQLQYAFDKSNGEVIETTEKIYKTQKEGDHAISLGYHISNNGDNTIAIGSASIVRGSNSVVLGALNNIGKYARNTIALGIGTNVYKENSVAIGTGVNVAGAGVVAIGSGVGVTKDNTIAVGYGAHSLSGESIVLGNDASLKDHASKSIVIGHHAQVEHKLDEPTKQEKIEKVKREKNIFSNGNVELEMSAIAIGAGSKVYAEKGVAFGNNAQVKEQASSAMALGNDAEATMQNSVALGYKSTTKYFYEGNTATTAASSGGPTVKNDSSTKTATLNGRKAIELDPYIPEGSSYNLATNEAAGIVSVGWMKNGSNGSGQELGLRRIVGVAPGALDSDVATIGQLKALAYVKKEGVVTYYTTEGDKIYKVVKNPEGKFFKVNTDNGTPLDDKEIDKSQVFAGPKGANEQPVMIDGKKTANMGELIKFGHIADGEIADQSNQAITGSQLNQLGKTILGLDVNSSDKTKFDTPKFTAVNYEGASQSGTNNQITTFKKAIDELITAVNKGLNIAGDDANGQLTLGSTLTIKAGNTTVKDDRVGTKTEYSSNNIRTAYLKDKKELLIGIKENPTFKKVTLSEEQTYPSGTQKNAVDKNDLITKGYLDGALANVASSFTVKGDDKSKSFNIDKSNTTLTIKGGNNITTAVDTTQKALTISLKEALTDITSITGKNGSGSNGSAVTKIEFNSTASGSNASTPNVKITAGGSTFTFGKDSLDLGNKKITQLADGVQEKDAVNLKQLNAAKLHFLSVKDNSTSSSSSSRNDNYDNDGATKEGAIAIGVGTKATAQNAVVIGKDVSIDVANSFVLGSNNTVTQTNKDVRSAVVVIGSGTKLEESKSSIAIGAVFANGKDGTEIKKAAWTTSIGNKNKIQNGTDILALGNNINIGFENNGSDEHANDHVVAIGNKANAQNAKNSVLIGAETKATSGAKNAVIIGYQAQSKAEGGVAIGQSAVVEATAGDSIALGKGSKAEAKKQAFKTQEINVGTKGLMFDWGSAGTSESDQEDKKKAVVSVGNTGSERIITNVAAGKVETGSTDAINAGQLHEVITVFGKLGTDILGAEVYDKDKGQYGFKASTFEKVNYHREQTQGQPQGQPQQPTAPKTFKEAIDETIKAVNAGMKFGVEGNGSNNPITKQLGDTLTFKGDGKYIKATVEGDAIKYSVEVATNIDDSSTPSSSGGAGAGTTGSTDKLVTASAVKNYVTTKFGALSSTLNLETDQPTDGSKNKGSINLKTDTLKITGDSNITTSFVSNGEKKLSIKLSENLTNISSIGKGSNGTKITFDDSKKEIKLGSVSVSVNDQHKIVIGEGSKSESNHTLAIGNKAIIGQNAKGSISIASLTNGEQGNIQNAEWAISIGNKNNVSGGNDIVALGSNITISKDNSKSNDSVIAIGNGVELKNALQSIGVGKHTKVTNSEWSVAIGNNTKITNGNDIVALGSNIEVTGSNNDSVLVFGNGAKASGAENSVVIGREAESKAQSAVVLGKGANVKQNATGAVAIGEGATVEENAGDSIALGKNSKAEDKKNAFSTAEITVGTNSLKFEWKGGISKNGQFNSVVSVGDVGSERIITNVAAGKIDASSTDAINGSQLDSVIRVFGNLGTDILGAEVNDKKEFTKTTFTKLKDATKKDDEVEAQMTFKGAIEESIKTINKGLTFKGDMPSAGTNGTQNTPHYLGSTIQIVRLATPANTGTTTTQPATTTPAITAYSGENLITQYSNTNGNAKIEIGFKNAPTFSKVMLAKEQTYNGGSGTGGSTDWKKELITKGYLEQALDKFKFKVSTGEGDDKTFEIGRGDTLKFTSGQNIQLTLAKQDGATSGSSASAAAPAAAPSPAPSIASGSSSDVSSNGGGSNGGGSAVPSSSVSTQDGGSNGMASSETASPTTTTTGDTSTPTTTAPKTVELNIATAEDLKNIKSISSPSKNGSAGGNGTDTEVTKLSLTSENATFQVGTTGAKVQIDKDGIALTPQVNGANGASGADPSDSPSITIKAGAKPVDPKSLESFEKDQGPSIAFSTKGTDGKKIRSGKITGLADLTDTSDGTSATNKNYVDGKVSDLNNNRPFDFYLDKEKVVKDKDGNFHKEKEPSKNLTEEEKKQVVIKAEPSTAPIGISNVASGLGLPAPETKEDAKKEAEKKATELTKAVEEKVKAIGEKATALSTTAQKVTDLTLAVSGLEMAMNAMSEGEERKQAEEKLKESKEKLEAAKKELETAKSELTKAKEGLTEANKGYEKNYGGYEKVAELVNPKQDSKIDLTNAATIGDLQAVAKSGMKFKGNDDMEIHTALSGTFAIKGEEGANGNKFNSDRTAAGNIKVEMSQDGKGLEVKLSDQLKNMTSFETREVDGRKSTLNSNGLIVVNKGADNKVKSATYGAEAMVLEDKGKNNKATITAESLTFADNVAQNQQNPKMPKTVLNKNGLTVTGANGEIKIDGEKGIITVPDIKPTTSGSAVVNKNYVDGKNNELRTQINTASRESRAGIAGALAAAGLPMSSVPGKSMFAASAGTFKGQNALALGYSRVSDNGKITLRLQGTRSSTGDVGGSVGVGYQW